MAARKLQSPSSGPLLAKISEGVELFESIYNKMQASTNQAQKETLELELKSQIKKLQRLRDQVKTWIASSDIKDKSQLLNNRKLIETQMEKFKACEKEMKTKAFSKEGLIQAAKLDPKEQEKEEATVWLQAQVEELQMQVEQSEAEIESLAGTRKKKKKSRTVAGRLEELNERRKWHISRLEIVLRLLNNGSLPTEKVLALKEDVQYFVESNTDEGFDEDEGIYDDLNLDEEEEKFGLAPEDDESDDSDGGSEDPSPRSKKNDEESVLPRPIKSEEKPWQHSQVLHAIHRGPWFGIHQNFASYVVYTLELYDGSSNEIVQLYEEWGRWDSLTSLANYRFVVRILFEYLTQSSDSNPESALDILDQISADLSCVLRQMNSILSNRETYKRFLSCRGAVAQQLLDLLQDLLDSPDELRVRTPFSKALFSKALLRLSRECGLHPTCFTLRGLEKVGRQVAGGGFGDIWKGLVGGQTVAVKSMRQFADDDVKASLKKLGREALIWRQLSHPNLLPFFGLYMLEDRLCLISPWMENGDLRLFLSIAPPDMNRVSLIADVAMGVEYLHNEHIVHGDLKTPNILVAPSGRACIADFGLSTIVDELSLKMTFSSRSGHAGTARYQAPELLESESPNHYGSDVYAFGCVSYEILTGKVPFFELANEVAIILKVVKGVRPSRLEVISQDLWFLLEDCWHQQTDQRPTMAAISQRLSRQRIGEDIEQSPPDWDDAYSARFRRSIQEGPLLPSVDEIERRLTTHANQVEI